MPHRRNSKKSPKKTQKRQSSRRNRGGKKTRRVKKGGAVRMPSEYFGQASNRYFAEGDPNLALTQGGHGQTVAVSYGVNHNGLVGPDMGPSPDATCTQTGGSKKQKSKRSHSKKNRKGKKGKTPKKHH